MPTPTAVLRPSRLVDGARRLISSSSPVFRRGTRCSPRPRRRSSNRTAPRPSTRSSLTSSAARVSARRVRLRKVARGRGVSAARRRLRGCALAACRCIRFHLEWTKWQWHFRMRCG
ncbi:hypothetical protein PsYK624_116040 [Phanerochaete sordida]|uniref:Uncharacterized protein n=1 Tax=Phanerochaete sordida TaxID=48140 RepID=A0A9P3GI07_9APHY|nr:hypothetical protein PsYK624_116040 [Phanerochaete sordida]